jgi:hypothetical protein
MTTFSFLLVSLLATSCSVCLHVQLSPLKGGGGGAASDSPELQALMGAEMMMGGPGALANVRDVDMLGLKRKLVIAEKARRWVKGAHMRNHDV